uniref:BTB and CNC homology 1, basic leucine zipper transcription factor 1 b n=1 Tax=Cyclopterus lumpus TaxID=8103 RepID=A0A8C2ZIE9_CYCLU
MATSACRSSVFTFESTVHSSHVLRCLDEQRKRDTMCDVTVVVEGHSFRAHRSILASCSEYFTHRISSLTQHGAVITLPQEVTVAGFEPLLKFAYTSKLLFEKDDVLEIRNSASILGFRDLDKACFDFLLPKFFSSSKSPAPVPRKTCCKKECKRQLSKKDCVIDSDDVLLDEEEVKPVADSPTQQEVARQCNKSVTSKIESKNGTGTLTPVAEGTNDRFMQRPKYRKFQLACSKETCFTEKSLNDPITVIKNDCDLPCSPCSSSVNSKKDVELPGNSTSISTRQTTRGADNPWKTEIHDQKTGDDRGRVTLSNNAVVEREVAEHLAKQLGSGMGLSQLNFQDPDAGSSSDTGSGRAQSTSLEWLKFNNISSTSTSCPVYQELDQSKCLWKGAELSECEGASQSGVSSLNSGEDGDSDTETEGDSESYTRERARQVQLPFTVECIVALSRNDFQQLLKQQVFTQEQLEFVHDMRRRSKNRLAAQRCRKRKLDCIYDLQCEIDKLKTEREKLMMEKSHLSQMRSKTCHSVAALCQRVCNEARLQPEQLQVLAQYTSPDCPLSSFFPHIDALLSQPELLLQPQASFSACLVGFDKYMASEEASSNFQTDTVSDGQHSL